MKHDPVQVDGICAGLVPFKTASRHDRDAAVRRLVADGFTFASVATQLSTSVGVVRTVMAAVEARAAHKVQDLATVGVPLQAGGCVTRRMLTALGDVA